MTRTPTAYVADAARALRQARTYLTDELTRIDAALAALDLEQAGKIVLRVLPRGEAALSAQIEAAGTVEPEGTVTCDVEGCDWTGKTPQALGHHRRSVHGTRGKAKPKGKHIAGSHRCDECGFVAATRQGLATHQTRKHAAPERPDDHDGHTIDVGPVIVVGEHVCDECGETFRWPADLARHRRALGHYADGDDQ